MIDVSICLANSNSLNSFMAIAYSFNSKCFGNDNVKFAEIFCLIFPIQIVQLSLYIGSTTSRCFSYHEFMRFLSFLIPLKTVLAFISQGVCANKIFLGFGTNSFNFRWFMFRDPEIYMAKLLNSCNILNSF